MDVLGLWPFTLDELVQAFHDYVSCLIIFSFFRLSSLASVMGLASGLGFFFNYVCVFDGLLTLLCSGF